jgi:hypothetical protein
MTITPTTAERDRQKRLYLELADSLQAVVEAVDAVAKDTEAPGGFHRVRGAVHRVLEALAQLARHQPEPGFALMSRVTEARDAWASLMSVLIPHLHGQGGAAGNPTGPNPLRTAPAALVRR